MSERKNGIDLIKTLASVLVVILHTQVNYFDESSFLLNGSLRSLIFYAIRYTAMTCVPMFLISTGYLQQKAKISKEYFSKLKNTLVPYFVITAAGEIYLHATAEHSEGLKDLIFVFFGYASNGYSWYVAMFIGLFLTIPFLNTLYFALSKRQRLGLHAILIILTILPSVQTSLLLPKIIPDFWSSFYPITYYFTGLYIREEKPHLGFKKFLLLFLLSVAAPISLQYAVSTNGKYVWYVMNGFNSLSAYIISTLLFVFLHDKKRPKNLIFRRLSANSLYIYLISYYVDGFVWKSFNSAPSLHSIALQSCLIYSISAGFAEIFSAAIRKSLLQTAVK